MQVRKITLTKELAKTLLEHNWPHNRSIKFTKINQMVRDLENGAWVQNGETLKISGALKNGIGRLIDGQHRCQAVLESGRPMDTLLVEGIDECAVKTIDCGTARNARDMLAVQGFKHTTATATSVKMYLIYVQTGQMYYRSKEVRRLMPSNHEVVEFVHAHPMHIEKLIELMNHYLGAFRLVTTSGLGAMVLYSRINLTGGVRLMEQLCQELHSGIGLFKTNPVHWLRERILLERQKRSDIKRIHLAQQEMFVGWSINAWNCLREQKEIRSFSPLGYVPRRDEFPLMV